MQKTWATLKPRKKIHKKSSINERGPAKLKQTVVKDRLLQNRLYLPTELIPILLKKSSESVRTESLRIIDPFVICTLNSAFQERKMTKSYTFAADVVRTICDRFKTKAAELKLMTDTQYSFEEWINWEAFLALKPGESNGLFCEVTAKPCYTYAHEGIVGDDGKPFKKSGDLLVGGPNDGSDHCWLFAEFVLFHDGTMDKWREKIDGDKQKLLRLNWKKSASLLIFVIASQHNVLTDWSEYFANIPTWHQPALIEPVVIALPGGGTVVVKAMDIKRDPKDVLALSVA